MPDTSSFTLIWKLKKIKIDPPSPTSWKWKDDKQLINFMGPYMYLFEIHVNLYVCFH
jgi:hypothetical protein